jgi:hypothetical protein
VSIAHAPVETHTPPRLVGLLIDRRLTWMKQRSYREGVSGLRIRGGS